MTPAERLQRALRWANTLQLVESTVKELRREVLTEVQAARDAVLDREAVERTARERRRSVNG